MADSENVKYSFEGDVKSLQKATEAAIGMLNRYEQAVAKAVTDGKFTASAKSTQTFNNAIAKTTKDITKMQAKLSKVGDVKLPTGSDTAKAFESTLGTITKQMNSIATATKVTTKDLTQFKTELNSTRTNLNSTSAQVDKLVNSEIRFQNILGTVKTKAEQVRGTMDSMKSKLSGTFEPITNKIRSLSGVFDNIKAKVQSFKDKAADAFSRVSSLASTVASAFRRTSSEADKGDASASRFAKALGGLKTIFSKVGSLASKVGSGFSSLLTTLGGLSTNITKTTSGMRNLSGATNLASKAFQTLVGVKIGDWLANATKESISYIENLNLFTVAMGDAIEEGTQFVATMQELYGMDPSNLMRYAGNFYQLATAIDMPDEAATNLSLSLTKAANDISSLFNVDIETVFENLSSGMQGMSRAVRKYGMDIRTTTLQQTALTLGITEEVTSMSEANRQGLRFLTMMRQASNASGDFARTIESPANQLKIFKEQMSQLGRAIGNFFIGPLGTAIAYLNGFIMALRTVLTFIGSIIGVITGISGAFDSTSAEDEADAIAGIGDAAGGAAKQMQNLAAPFDELNVLQENTSSGGGGGGLSADEIMDPAIAQAIADMEYKFEEITMKANQVRDAILSFLGFEVDMGEIISWDPSVLEDNLINKFPQWTKTIQAVFNNWSDIIEGFKNVFHSIVGVLDTVKTKFLDFLSIFINDDTVSDFINNLAGSLNNLSDWISEHEDGIANFILTLGALWAGFQAFKSISTLIAPIAQFIATVSGAIAPFATVIGTIGAVVAAIYVLYQSSTEFAGAFDGLLSSVVEGLVGIVGAASEALSNIWSGMQTLWANNIQPMLQSIGDALAPVIKTVSSLWNSLTRIIINTFQTISNIWTNTLQPVLAAFFDAIGNLASIFENLWANIVGPIIEYIGTGIADLWESTISPIVEQVIDIIGAVIEIVLALWNNVLSPLINWLINVLGPSVKNLVMTVWNIVKQLFEDIGGVIQGLLTALQGVLDFIAGVFTGDWERAWKGIKNIFIGVGNGLISVFETVVNGIISLINGMISLVYNAVIGLINSVLDAVSSIAGLLGFDLDITITAPPPAIGYLSIPRIPVAMAQGGVVTAPTQALIGEGAYDEAVIPLGESPQMAELVQKIADAVDREPNDKPTEVRVYIGDREWDAFTYESAERGSKLVGAQPIKIGG